MTIPLVGAGASSPFVFVMDWTTNLIFYYKLEEASGTRDDAQGANDLTDNNTVGQTTGIQGNAALFVRANSEYLSCADNANLSIGDTSFTLTAWVKLNTTGVDQGIVSRWGDGYEFRLWYQDFNRFRFAVKGTNETSVTADAFGSPSTGVWYFLVAIHDATNDEIKISVNNGSFNTASHALGANDSGATLRLGLHDSNYLDGALDEVALWKGRILTADELTYLYNSGSGRTLP